MDSAEDDSLFLLLESDPDSRTDEDEHREDLVDDFREMLRSDEEENALDDVDPDISTDVDDPDDGEDAVDEGVVLPSGPVLLSADADDDSSVFVDPDEEDLLQLFRAFYAINRSPTDDQFHSLADALGVPYDKLEESLFKLIGDSLASESVDAHEVD